MFLIESASLIRSILSSGARKDHLIYGQYARLVYRSSRYVTVKLWVSIYL